VLVQTTMSVETVEADGRWWIDVTVGGHRLERRGPYKKSGTAQLKADRLIKAWRGTTPAAAAGATTVTATADGDLVTLHGKPVALDSDLGRKFVIDCTRAAEELIDDKVLQEVYEISPEELAKTANNVTLGRAIREEGRRRVRNGLAAREAAQQSFVKSPKILDTIMSDGRASPRHRIEAAREIRAVAIGGAGDESPASSAERFIITFNMGSDVERIEQIVEPRPKQIPSEFDTVPTSENKIDGECI